MAEKQKIDKLQEILLSVFVILFVRIIFTFLFDFTPIVDFFCKTYENQYYNKYVYAEGKINEYVLDETSKLITQGNVPKSLSYYFYKNGGMIYVTDKNLTEMCYDESERKEHNVLGFFHHEKGEYYIYFSNNLNDIMYGTLEHEFGHYLDYSLGWYSMSSNFEKIFNEEKEEFQKNINDNEHYNTQKEYFAECYSIYFFDKEKLKRYCPQTYNIIKFLIDSLETSYNIECNSL